MAIDSFASRASIFPSRRVNSTGLVSKSSHPAASAASRSPAIACEESAITGISRVSADALRRLVASQPSRTGRLKSIRISAGRIRSRAGQALLAIGGDDYLVAFAF